MVTFVALRHDCGHCLEHTFEAIHYVGASATMEDVIELGVFFGFVTHGAFSSVRINLYSRHT